MKADSPIPATEKTNPEKPRVSRRGPVTEIVLLTQAEAYEYLGISRTT
jgi:hypothetical protein